MLTSLQHHRRRERMASRARAEADRNYWQVGYMDSLLNASPRVPYPSGSAAADEWLAGYREAARARTPVVQS